MQMTEEQKTYVHRAEAMLFVAGDPVSYDELSRVLSLPAGELKELLSLWAEECREEGRGILPFCTEESVRLVTSGDFEQDILSLLQPEQTKSVSRSMMETLAVIAYRQPVTRGDIEAVRGVRCEYAVGQLLQFGLIRQSGRRDTPGRPALFVTTDAFLHRFGLHSLEELPSYGLFSGADADLSAFTESGLTEESGPLTV